MSYTQFFLQLLGWGFIFYLHSRNLRRTELGRLKDSFLSQLKNDIEWLNEKIKNIPKIKSNKSDATTLQIEEIVASKIAQLEEKIEHLNLIYKRNVFDPAMLSELYGLNIFDLVKAEDYERSLNIIETSISTKINAHYTHNLYLNYNVKSFWDAHKEELWGAILGSALILIWTLIFIIWL